MSQAHFGVMTPQIKRSWADARRAATAFEEMGYDSIWVNDHLYGPQSPSIPILEAWSEVAALAASTERVEIGTLVTPAGMRNPAHLGKVIATVDHISDGRIIAGIGGRLDAARVHRLQHAVPQHPRSPGADAGGRGSCCGACGMRTRSR